MRGLINQASEGLRRSGAEEEASPMNQKVRRRRRMKMRKQTREVDYFLFFIEFKIKAYLKQHL